MADKKTPQRAKPLKKGKSAAVPRKTAGKAKKPIKKIRITPQRETSKAKDSRKSPAAKNKGGRPTRYKKEFAVQAKVLCRLGAIDKDLAEFFGVKEQTINNWKKSHPEFFESLKESKEGANEIVKQSLFKRAIGYSHPDLHISSHQGKITKTKLTKHYPPETVAAIFWLKNRDPENWRDKFDHDIQGDIVIKTDSDDDKL